MNKSSLQQELIQLQGDLGGMQYAPHCAHDEITDFLTYGRGPIPSHSASFEGFFLMHTPIARILKKCFHCNLETHEYASNCLK